MKHDKTEWVIYRYYCETENWFTERDKFWIKVIKSYGYCLII